MRQKQRPTLADFCFLFSGWKFCIFFFDVSFYSIQLSTQLTRYVGRTLTNFDSFDCVLRRSWMLDAMVDGKNLSRIWVAMSDDGDDVDISWTRRFFHCAKGHLCVETKNVSKYCWHSGAVRTRAMFSGIVFHLKFIIQFISTSHFLHCLYFAVRRGYALQCINKWKRKREIK